MIMIVLRARGRDFPLDHFIQKRQLDVSLVWRKGEVSHRGKILDDSGFNLSLPNAKTWAESRTVIQSFLQTERELIRELLSYDTGLTLDIGVTVGSESSFAPSLLFPIDLLSELASNEINLAISAYPSSDEGGK